MTTRQFPWTDVRDAPWLLLQSWRRHLTSGSPAVDFTFGLGWKQGPHAHAEGPFMISVTQYTPTRLTDLPDIWLAAESLGDQLIQIDGAVGVMTYLRPGRRHLGSMSIWADDRGLKDFIKLPDHVEIMRKYRPRGLPLRSATWWSDELEVSAAVTEGLRILDNDQQQRVVRSLDHTDP
ncbi:hypothetical protein ACFWPK_32695 [Nocardia sp. NPDC058519]|uniref:hypothetical protein n=1 Tax=Nocardia sp. NPDC058519 TaxID=3346535 RepID=UPI0036643D7D